MPGVLMELEMRSVEPGDMKSVIVDEMSILWSAIRSSAEQRRKADFTEGTRKELVGSAEVCRLLRQQIRETHKHSAVQTASITLNCQLRTKACE